MKCWFNKIVVTLKYFKPYRCHIRPVLGKRGIVVGVYGKSPDGDFTFDIKSDQPEHYRDMAFEILHCEIMPCNRKELKSFIEKLEKRFNEGKERDIKVEVDGMLT